MIRLAPCFLAASVLALAGCRADAPETAPTPVAQVSVQPASILTLHRGVDALGTVEFAAPGATSVTLPVELQVAEVLVTEGEHVDRGQPLLRLTPSPATQLELGKARREAELAAAERDRMGRMRKDGLVTNAEWQAAVDAAETASAVSAQLGQQVGPGGQRLVLAPREGILDLLAARPGEVLPPGTVVARIASADELQVRLGVEPQEAQLIATGQTVTLVPLAPGAASVAANVSGLDRRVDPQTRLVAALVKLPRRSGLLPGAVLRARILVDAHANIVAVPREALLYAGESAYVFVAKDGYAHRRGVTVGYREGGMAEITQGLAAGETVVVAGNSVLDEGMAVRVGPAVGKANGATP